MVYGQVLLLAFGGTACFPDLRTLLNTIELRNLSLHYSIYYTLPYISYTTIIIYNFNALRSLS